VDPGTAALVLNAAERLGYAPNASARSLVTSRTGIVAVVLADITNPFYPQLVEVLHEQLARTGYRMILFNERTDSRGEGGIERLLGSGGADGVVFLSVTVDAGVAELLASTPVPAVLLNRDAEAPLVDHILADHEGGAAQVADLLVRLGHTRIAFIGGPANTSTSRGREAGLRAALVRYGQALPAAMTPVGEFTHQSGFQWAMELLTSEQPPTAIFCANDVIAFGALDATRRLQIKVPEQVSIVGFDDIPMAGWDTFSLTTVRQQLTEMARDAARLLIERIEDGDGGEPRRIVFPTHLVQRSTTGPAPG
jgi:LacI family transcriptional regulator